MKKNLDNKLDKLENIDSIDNVKTKKERVYEKLNSDELKLQSDLQSYYRDHFQISNLWRVIKKENFDTREFGFNRLKGGFTRNKSFAKPAHLHEYLFTFPVIGAYIGSRYKLRLLPADKNNEAITIHNATWMERELIFDLDLDDYNPVRRCKCKGKDVCEDCWGLMQEASDIMHETFVTDFGFDHIEWVYTAGRGYHAWILDPNTSTLNQAQRTAIVNYMQLIHDPKALQKIDELSDVSTLLKRRIYEKLARNFILNESNKFLIENAGYNATSLKRARTVLSESKLISDILDAIPSKKEGLFRNTLIKYHYPRIDHKVTIDIRRLIRMPGSIHIRSKNISRYVQNPTTFNPINDADNMYDVLD